MCGGVGGWEGSLITFLLFSLQKFRKKNSSRWVFAIKLNFYPINVDFFVFAIWYYFVGTIHFKFLSIQGVLRYYWRILNERSKYDYKYSDIRYFSLASSRWSQRHRKLFELPVASSPTSLSFQLCSILLVNLGQIRQK